MKRILNILLMVLHNVGHIATGVYLTNTRIIGLPESRYKILILMGHLFAWPLAGLVSALKAGGFSGFGSSLLRPLSPGWFWRVFYTLLGLRWIVQEAYRKLGPSRRPQEARKVGSQRHDITAAVLRYEGLDSGGIRGVLHRLNRLYDLELALFEVTLPRLSGEFDGFSILQISDVHRLPGMSDEFIRSYVRLSLKLDPDLIVLTGDYQTYRGDILPVARLLAPLGEWSCSHGGEKALAILGNHDHEAGAAHVVEALQRSCIKVLRNRHVRIEREGSSLYVAGVDDPWSGCADLGRALKGIPQRGCTILLAHEPDYLDKAAKAPVDFQLSGHNHGGQITFPLIGPVLVSSRYGRRYAEGFHKTAGTLMYVNRGLGGKPPIRWGARPEITMFVMRDA